MGTQGVGLRAAVSRLWAAGSPEGAGRWEGRRCPTLAGGAAVPRWDERVAAAQRLTGSAAAGHKAFQAGTQVAGRSGLWKLLAAQVGLPKILTALKRGQREAGWGPEGVRGQRSPLEACPWPESKASETGPWWGGRHPSRLTDTEVELWGESDWPKGKLSPVQPAENCSSPSDL